jgi:uncharacterized protein (TIGR02246 family)
MQTAHDPAGEAEVRALYHDLLESWNRRDAAAFAALFTPDATVVGFDGSQMNGRAEIESSLRSIFAHHVTAAYVGLVREVRPLAIDVRLLRAVAGMVPPGETELNPAVNTIQALVAVAAEGQWRIAHYQNTPAQFHGRPDLAEALTAELRKLL